jgi:hypothetical protein
MNESFCPPSWSLPEPSVPPLIPDLAFPDPSLKITVKLFGAIESSITVSLSDTVSALSPDQRCTFIHKGRLLCPALSLGFLKIQDGDPLFVVEKPERPAPLPKKSVHQLTSDAVNRLRQRFDGKYGHRFRDPDAVFEQMRDAVDPVTARESARIADLFKMRIDNQPAIARKVAARLSQMETGKHQQIPTVIPGEAVSPSTASLPVTWAAQ